MTADDIIADDNAAIATFTVPQLQAAYRWATTLLVSANDEAVKNLTDYRRQVATACAALTDQENTNAAAINVAAYLGMQTP